MANPSQTNYYLNSPLFTRTDRDLKELSYFLGNMEKTNYGPNPDRMTVSQYTQNGPYKNLSSAYNPNILNQCEPRWDNDQEEWERKMNKSGKGLK